MGTGGYKIRNKGATHFITFAVVDWVDVFTRQLYCDLVVDSIRHCQQNKGLILNAWCLMSNHLHLLASAQKGDLSNILRDFKKFTSRQILKSIESNCRESRRQWMLSIFRQHGTLNSRNTEYQFWQQDNHPEECYSPAFTAQKRNYIHKNPVAAGIVDKPEDYIYSSARAYHSGKQEGLLEIEFI